MRAGGGTLGLVPQGRYLGCLLRSEGGKDRPMAAAGGGEPLLEASSLNFPYLFSWGERRLKRPFSLLRGVLGYPRGCGGTHPSRAEGGHSRPALTSYHSSVCPREAKGLSLPAGLGGLRAQLGAARVIPRVPGRPPMAEAPVH